MTNLMTTQRVCVYCYLMFGTFVVNYYRTLYQLVCIIYFVQQFIVGYKRIAAVNCADHNFVFLNGVVSVLFYLTALRLQQAAEYHKGRL